MKSLRRKIDAEQPEEIGVSNLEASIANILNSVAYSDSSVRQAMGKMAEMERPKRRTIRTIPACNSES